MAFIEPEIYPLSPSLLSAILEVSFYPFISLYYVAFNNII